MNRDVGIPVFILHFKQKMQSRHESRTNKLVSTTYPEYPG